MESTAKQVTRAKVVADARSMLGVRWVNQGRNPATGVDCLGFGVVICMKNGIRPLMDRADYQIRPPGDELRDGLKRNLLEITADEAREADVAHIKFPFDDDARHIGVLARSLMDKTTLMIIHALNHGSVKEVVEEPFERWIPHTVGYYRFPGIVG